MVLRQLAGILLLVLVNTSTSFAQPYLVQGSIEHSGQGLIYLASYYGDRFRVADSIDSSSGSFLFMLSDEHPAGVYRLVFSDEYQDVRNENHFVEFIFNHEDLTLNVSVDEHGPHPAFESSAENQVYLEFMTFQLAYEEKLTEVYGDLFSTRPGDELHQVAAKRYEDLQRKRMWFMDSLSQQAPDLYATRIMNAFRAPMVSGSLSHAERIEALRQHFFDLAPIEDPALLYAPVYTYRMVDYLSLYSVDTLSMEEQEDRFMEAVDQIMLHVAPLPELYSFVLDFLLQGFDYLGMEAVQLHLADYYNNAACESDLSELVRERMDGYRKMKVGATAPDFMVRDAGGINYKLSSIQNPYTLVMFWSSTCGHCREMIPQLKSWYMEENSIGLEVVAISIDSSAALYEEYISREPQPWITVHEPLGWQGVLASQYEIYATPTLFLVDRERNILARPATVRQLQRSVKKLQ